MNVTTELRPLVCVITVDDGTANALTLSVIHQLRDAVKAAIEADRAVVLAGRPGYFCAGFDLKVLTGADRAARDDLLVAGAALYRDLITAPVPIIAACTGHALAGGALLLLSCDYRIGSPQPAKIGLTELQLGLPLPAFALIVARHRLEARYLTVATLLAEIAGPIRAVELGYLDALADAAVGEAVEHATRWGRYARKAFAVTKRRLNTALLEDLDSVHPPDVIATSPSTGSSTIDPSTNNGVI